MIGGLSVFSFTLINEGSVDGGIYDVLLNGRPLNYWGAYASRELPIVVEKDRVVDVDIVLFRAGGFSSGDSVNVTFLVRGGGSVSAVVVLP